MASFKIVGLDKVNRQIDKMSRDMPKQIDTELKKFADSILSDALSRVPDSKGMLKASGSVIKIEGGYSIGFSAKYAPYQEFGTGPLTEVPTGYESYAMEFFVSGNGHTPPEPFLFPAYLSKRDKVVEELTKGLTDLISKFNLS